MSARWAFLFLYFLSGATALLYQVVWARRLTLEMGQTAAAVSTVLAAFMGGLALGAHLGGRWASGRSARSALAMYAALEAAIALFALLVDPLLGTAKPLLVSAYRDGVGGGVFFATRLLISLAIVAIPATAMGATLPAAARWSELMYPARSGRLAGLLYAANTLGAGAGAALTGFVLLPALGLQATTMAGVAANAFVGLGALLLRRRTARGPDPQAGTSPPTVGAARASGPSRRSTRGRPAGAPATIAPAPAAAAAVLAVSGFSALAYEVAWTRVIALVAGPTTYAFTMMVTIFILGLGAGGGIGGWLAGRPGARPRLLLAWAQVAAAIAALAAAGFVPHVQLSVADLVARPGAGLGDLLIRATLLLFVVLLPMTAALGASFPFGVAMAAPEAANITRPLALVYVCNTLGAIAGALVCGFVLLPQVGLQRSLFAAALLEAAAAAALVPRLHGRSHRVALGAAAILVVMVTWAQPRWSRVQLAGGLYRPGSTGRVDPEVERAAGALLYYGDGAAGSVSVRRVAGEISLAINGKVDASNGADMITQKLLAHLPLLLHAAPRDVLVIGLGSGVTTGAALVHPVRAVDTLELSPEVVRASAFFAEENRHASADPRSHVLIGDGRSHLRLTRQRYDAIISEPSNPWMAGVAPLFTREVFEAARERLRPGGLFCQWAHTYEMSRPDFESIAATFVAVFPGSSLWLVGEGDVLLVGMREGEAGPRLELVEAGWRRPGVAADLASVSVGEPATLLGLHVASDRHLAAFAAGARIQTDDQTSLEFTAPASLFGPRNGSLASDLRQFADDGPRPAAVVRAEGAPTAATWRARAALLAGARAYDAAWQAARRALELDAGSRETCDPFERIGVASGRTQEAISLLEQAVQRHPDALSPRLTLSRLQAVSGQPSVALGTAVQTVQAFPDEPRALAQLAAVVADSGDAEKLRPVVDHLARTAPGSWPAVYYAATLDFLEGRFADAAAGGERAAGLDQADARALTLVGASEASAGHVDRARAAFTQSLARNPRDPITSINLGRLELAAGRPDAAARHFAEALLADPSSLDARRGFDEARVASR
jgi:spermidine synthase